MIYTQLYTLKLYSPSQTNDFVDSASDESPSTTCTKKETKDPGPSRFAFANRDPSLVINFTHLTRTLQFLNSTPQHDERTTFICCFIRAA